MPGPFTAMIAITITPAAYKALNVMRPETEDAPAGAEIRIWLEQTFFRRTRATERPPRELRRSHSQVSTGEEPQQSQD